MRYENHIPDPEPRAGSVDRAADESSAEWRPIDFGELRLQVTAREIERIRCTHLEFASEAAAQLGTLIRRPVRIELGDIETHDHRAAACRTDDSAGAWRIACDRPTGHFDVEIGSRLSQHLLSLLLGRTRPPESNEARPQSPSKTDPLSPLEIELVGVPVERLLEALAVTWPLDGAWGRSLGLDVVGSAAADPRGVEELERSWPCGSTPWISIDFRVSIDTEVGRILDSLRLLIPFGPLLFLLSSTGEDQRRHRRTPLDTSVRERPKRRSQATERQRLLETIRHSELELLVELESAPLPLYGLFRLEPGDLIDTGLDAGAGVTMHFGEQPLTRVDLGRLEGRRAVVLRASTATA